MGSLEIHDLTMNGPVSAFSIHMRNEVRFSLLNHGLLNGHEPPEVVEEKVNNVLADVIRGLDYCLAMEQRMGERRRFTNHDEVRSFLKERLKDVVEVDQEYLIEWLERHGNAGKFKW